MIETGLTQKRVAKTLGEMGYKNVDLIAADIRAFMLIDLCERLRDKHVLSDEFVASGFFVGDSDSWMLENDVPLEHWENANSQKSTIVAYVNSHFMELVLAALEICGIKKPKPKGLFNRLRGN